MKRWPLEGFKSDSRADLNANSYSFDLHQTLFDWSRIQSARAAATRDKSARLKVSAARQRLMVRVAKTYFAVLEARDRLAGAHQKTASIQRQAQRARALYQAGVQPVIDALEAQSRLDSIKVKAIEAENKLEAARQRLRQLVGRKPERLKGVQVNEPLPFMAR